MVFTHDDFDDVDLYTAKRYCQVTNEGDPDFFDGNNVEDNNINEENDEDVELGEEVVRVMGVRIPAQDEINHIQQVVCIDDDNSPAPKNIPREATSLNIFDDIFSNWGHDGVCERKRNSHFNNKPSIAFPGGIKPTPLQVFELMFPKTYVQNVILKQLNEKKDISYGEFLRWIGLWLLMSTIEGPTRRDFFLKVLRSVCLVVLHFD